jgi:hypothetical protein
VSEEVQLQFSSVESQSVKRTVGIWCETACQPRTHLVELSVDKSSA